MRARGPGGGPGRRQRRPGAGGGRVRRLRVAGARERAGTKAGNGWRRRRTAGAAISGDHRPLARRNAFLAAHAIRAARRGRTRHPAPDNALPGLEPATQKTADDSAAGRLARAGAEAAPSALFAATGPGGRSGIDGSPSRPSPIPRRTAARAPPPLGSDPARHRGSRRPADPVSLGSVSRARSPAALVAGPRPGSERDTRRRVRSATARRRRGEHRAGAGRSRLSVRRPSATLRVLAASRPRPARRRPRPGGAGSRPAGALSGLAGRSLALDPLGAPAPARSGILRPARMGL